MLIGKNADVTGLIAYLLSENPELRDDTAGMKAKLLASAINLSTDKGTIKFANNGFSGAAL